MNKTLVIVPTLYIFFLMLPIYGLADQHVIQDDERDSWAASAFIPQDFTLENYITIFTDPTWYNGVSEFPGLCRRSTRFCRSRWRLPAAYAFSAVISFIGDKHLFFWLLTNRMAPPAVFRASVLSALLGGRPVRHPYCGGPGPLPCSTSRSRFGSWKASCRACQRNWMRRPISMATPFWGFFIKYLHSRQSRQGSA